MREGRSELCLLFASKMNDEFEHVDWTPTGSGLPRLAEDSLAWAECTTAQELEIGDPLATRTRYLSSRCRWHIHGINMAWRA